MDSDFEPVKLDEGEVHGRPAFLACGCPVELRATLRQFADDHGFAGTPFIFAGTDDLEKTVGAVFRKESGDLPAESKMPWTIVFSGLTNQQFCRFIDLYKSSSGLRVPHWGVLMPQTETWTLCHLLKNYQADAKATSRK